MTQWLILCEDPFFWGLKWHTWAQWRGRTALCHSTGGIFDIMILCYKDIFQLLVSLWKGDRRGKPDEGKSGKPQHSLWAIRNDQDLPGGGGISGMTEERVKEGWERRERCGNKGAEEERAGRGDRWRRTNKCTRGERQGEKGEKRGNGGPKLGAKPLSTKEDVWKWSHQSRIGMGGFDTHAYI